MKKTVLLFALLFAVPRVMATPAAVDINLEPPAFVATSYCKGQVTYSGIPVKRGMAASDPKFIPIGSIIRVTGTGDDRWDGVYSVLDTGPEIQGRELDLYFWSCYEALDFGRRKVTIEIVRKGWDPNGKGLR